MRCHEEREGPMFSARCPSHSRMVLKLIWMTYEIIPQYFAQKLRIGVKNSLAIQHLVLGPLKHRLILFRQPPYSQLQVPELRDQY